MSENPTPADTHVVTAPVPPPSPHTEKKRTVNGHIVFAIALLLLLALLWKLRDVVELVYVSALFAVVLMPVVKRVEAIRIGRFQPPRVVAIIALMVVVVGLLFTLFFFGLPPVIQGIQHFAADLPNTLPKLLDRIKKIPLANRIGVDNIAARVEAFAATFATHIVDAAPKWLGNIFDLLAALIMTIYFMLEGEAAYYYALSMVPAESRTRLSKTLLTAEHRMSKWLIGQGALMLILGVCSIIVYGILHVRYFFLLGALMGLLNIIPIIGAVVTVLLSAAVAAMDSWAKMWGVLIFYAIYSQVENGFLTPRIMKTSVNLMGLSVLIALLAGAALAGVVGALVSVPTAALIGVLVQEYLVQRDADAKELAAKADALE